MNEKRLADAAVIIADGLCDATRLLLVEMIGVDAVLVQPGEWQAISESVKLAMKRDMIGLMREISGESTGRAPDYDTTERVVAECVLRWATEAVLEWKMRNGTNQANT